MLNNVKFPNIQKKKTVRSRHCEKYFFSDCYYLLYDTINQKKLYKSKTL